jgi:hypothetical protein
MDLRFTSGLLLTKTTRPAPAAANQAIVAARVSCSGSPAASTVDASTR